MNKPTIEDLLQQILSTCLLINAQRKWHAHFGLVAHCGWAEVRMEPASADYQDKARPTAPGKYVTYTSTTLFPHDGPSDDKARQDLTELLTWVQSYLCMEAVA